MHLFIIPFLLFLSLPCFAREMVQESRSQVWRVEDRRWSVEDEYAFGRWVETTLTEDFFLRYKIPVDCADVPYAVRWIYARIAHLPAAATTKDGQLIGHWSTNWKNLPTHSEWHRDQRFRRALLHMLSETTTRTLPLDTYPVRIAPDSITPGTVFFITESHSGIISHVVLDGSYAHPLQTWEATVPAKLQKMNQRSFLSPRPESTIYSGLVKFRWPIYQKGRWTYLPAKDHPFYSEEQYGSDFYEGDADFVEAVSRRIDPRAYDPWEKAERVMETILRFLRERIPIVLAGNRQCRKGRCPEGSNLWEIYSTPGRDGMITLLMDHLHQIIESNQLDRDRLREKMEAIRIPISRDRTVTFRHVYENHLWFSPHPGDSIEARWGLKKCEMILSQIRSAKKSIAFIEKTYESRDPGYASFAIRQQEEIIRRLSEEWKRSRCRETPPPTKKKAANGIRKN
ncbi:MAG: hypothetical protein HXY46_13460 [Syntrophaceae bacterium]|nr:hypothetical protein [Syntrophaceae bacterium]